VDATDFLKLVVNPDRLAVVGLVTVKARTTAELAAETGQDPRSVLATLAPLVQAGLIVRDGKHYTLQRETLRELAGALPQPPPPDREVLLRDDRG
jgi:DNA-binding IclR family transcriptional regulator